MSKVLYANLSTSARKLVKWLGYNKEALPKDFKQALETYVKNGAVKKIGQVDSIRILHRNDGSSPVHRSSSDPSDKELHINARIAPANGSRKRIHHIFADGTGAMKKGDRREFSTSLM
ncbi:hypothetical protein F5X99DRAFT_428882 [Biscogniauxia marginata]|nr:hypothetical protein F5X99DRAFT_428882 [Biscogniauxia marginata]